MAAGSPASQAQGGRQSGAALRPQPQPSPPLAKPTRARNAQAMKNPPPRRIPEERRPVSASDAMRKEKAACGGAGPRSDLGDSQAGLVVEATPTGPTSEPKGEAVVTKVLHPNPNPNPSPHWCCIRPWPRGASMRVPALEPKVSSLKKEPQCRM